MNAFASLNLRKIEIQAVAKAHLQKEKAEAVIQPVVEAMKPLNGVFIKPSMLMKSFPVEVKSDVQINRSGKVSGKVTLNAAGRYYVKRWRLTEKDGNYKFLNSKNQALSADEVVGEAAEFVNSTI